MLRQLLAADFLLGGVCGLAGMLFSSGLAQFFGLPQIFLFIISTITFLYAVVAFICFKRFPKGLRLIRILIIANFLWAAISCVFIYLHSPVVTAFGLAFLFLQVVVVGGLAWLEANAFRRYVATVH